MNYYRIILGLAIVGGLLAAFWGWRLLARSRTAKNWPAVKGVIEESKVDGDEMLPHIVFSFIIGGQTYRQTLEYPAGASPMPELVHHYLEKYPLNAPVQVHYDPADPQRATLEPGAAPGDWFIVATGLAIALFALLALLFGGT